MSGLKHVKFLEMYFLFSCLFQVVLNYLYAIFRKKINLMTKICGRTHLLNHYVIKFFFFTIINWELQYMTLYNVNKLSHEKVQLFDILRDLLPLRHSFEGLLLYYFLSNYN